MPGTEAENEPQSLTYFDEQCELRNTLLYKLRIWLRLVKQLLSYSLTKSKVGGAFIQAGAFIRHYTVYAVLEPMFIITF